ncbi:MAG: glycoside hydrolase family 92 protein, partial [Prevotella sp.]|nr:glycoside hydrolase family 92 protein [Prevotella sp.]
LENGKKVTIKAGNNSKENRYVNGMTVNGQPYTKNYLTHDTLLKGATINYLMAPNPNKNKGININDTPYSFSKERNSKKK